MKRRHLLAGTIASAALITTSWASRAQTFPDKPIRFVVPYAPGGATDTSARIAAEYLSNKLGHQVMVANPAVYEYKGRQYVAFVAGGNSILKDQEGNP